MGALVGKDSRLTLGLGDLEDLAGLDHVGESDDHDGNAGTGLLGPFAEVVAQRPDLAVHRAGDDVVADPQGAVLEQHGGQRAASALDV